MQGMVLTISDSGKVESIYSEEFNLGFLGDQRVFRQTDIVFDADTQKWDIHYLNEQGVRVFGDIAPLMLSDFQQYEEARKFEVAWLNACREEGVVAGSYKGLALAKKMRQ